MQSALLLIALGFGFKVFADAQNSNKQGVKNLGSIVGIIIMAVSLIGTICTVYCTASGKNCPLMGRGMRQPHNEEMMMPMMRGGKKMMCPLGEKPEAPNSSMSGQMPMKDFMKFHGSMMAKDMMPENNSETTQAPSSEK